MSTLKEQKEEFVTGFAGTSPQELLLVCSTAPIGLWFYLQLTELLQPWLPSTATKYTCVLLEVVSFSVPMILCQSNLLYPLGVGYLSLQAIVSASLIAQKKAKRRSTSAGNAVVVKDSRRSALTIYRSAMLYLTIVAILAVDFRLFPRRFAKTEVRGYSLMDLGAASFVVAAGLVSPRARAGTLAGTSSSYKSLHRVIPVLFMGLLRLVTHKGIEYQEHASEYGIHWNFFFTIAMLAPTASLLPGPTCFVPVLVMASYQYCLSYQGLQEWVEQAPRSCTTIDVDDTRNAICDLFAANREGVLGVVGYSALYLISEWISFRFFWNPSSTSSSLGSATLAILVTWRILVSAGFDVSRRTTNAVFCVWALFVSCVLLCAIQFIYEHSEHPAVPALFDAANRNSLIVFVIANLLTGLVNLSINTLQVHDGKAFGILMAYISVVSAVAVLVDYLFQYTRKKESAPSKQHTL